MLKVPVLQETDISVLVNKGTVQFSPAWCRAKTLFLNFMLFYRFLFVVVDLKVKIYIFLFKIS